MRPAEEAWCLTDPSPAEATDLSPRENYAPPLARQPLGTKPCRGAGPRRHCAKNDLQIHLHPRRARAQSQEHLARSAARAARGDHRALGLGQVLARLRHHLCRGPAALCRVAVGLCAAVPRHDAEAGRRPYRRACRRPSPSSRRPPRATRARPSAPSPRSTTICGCSGRGSASPIRRRPGFPIESQTVSQMVDRVLALPEGTRLYLLAPIARGRKGEYKKEFAELQKKGFQRLKIDGKFYEIAEAPALDKKIQARHRRGGRPHRGAPRHRARGSPISFETALQLTDDGIAIAEFADETSEAHHLLGEVRLPGVGLHHRGDRAQAVLLQQSLWRLPGMRRARHRAVLRAGAGRAGRKL